MPNWIDVTPDLANQTLCSRLVFWPCQCCLALSNATVNCDCCGLCKVLWCCPCRTFCGWYATDAEQEDPHPEPEEIPYNLVFEMEQKKRQKMGTQIF